MELDFSRLMAMLAWWNMLDIVAHIQHRTSKVQSSSVMRNHKIYELVDIKILVKTMKVVQ